MRTARCKYRAPNHKERMKKASLNVMGHCRTVALLPVLVLLLHGCALRTARPGAAVPGGAPPAEVLARQVEVIRTDYGVPHIYAEDFRALGYALGYLQSEDYGARVARGLVRARGELARYEGMEALDSDFFNRSNYLYAVERYAQLEPDTQDVYEGFAAGVNRYIDRHAEEFPDWMRPDFTGYDVAALNVYRPSPNLVRRWRQRLRAAEAPLLLNPAQNGVAQAALGVETRAALNTPIPGGDDPIEPGSSAWALGPGRTDSGAAILLRNPHLGWNAGYWEAHAVIAGRLDFYGDFRIGGPLVIIGGFNRQLGFATTNNSVDREEVYALEADPIRRDHFRFDGGSRPIHSELITLPYRDGNGYGIETREEFYTDLGPVIYRDDTHVYVLRDATDGNFRAGEQFLRLMQARNLDEWTDAMQLRAHPQSNFIYADAEGNIFYLWNGAIPVRPHPAGGTQAVPATGMEQVWTEIHELDTLPQLLNPAGGYIRNENDAPWFTNLQQPLDPANYPPYFEEHELRLRSQHSLLLIDNDQRFSLEDVVGLKHSYRMLLADRVKDDLVQAVRKALSTGTITGSDGANGSTTAAALELLELWDNTAAPEDRGAVLFEEWWRTYLAARGEAEPFAEPWSAEAPVDTPRGLAAPELAARAFPIAVEETVRRFGSWSVPWGEVHRVRHGSADEPVGGCAASLGCFRVLNFRDEDDGRRSAAGGDGWVLAVEFTDPPRAFSILAYGQSAKENSPHHADQAALFARGEMKPVAYTREDVERLAVRRYRPGLE